MKMLRSKWWVVALAVLVVLLVGVWTWYRVSSRPKAPQVDTDATFMGTLIGSTADSISIETGSRQKTFSISSTTEIVTEVATGEVGKSLADIPANTMVSVHARTGNNNAAYAVVVLTPPSITNTNNIGPVSQSTGKLSKVTDSVVTITVGSSTIDALLTKDTTVITSALPGQKGKALSDIPLDTYVTITGYATMDGFVAGTIEVRTPFILLRQQ